MPLPAFRRSPTNRKVAGLFGGLGESFAIDATYLRLGFILFALVTGVLPALIGYAIGWVITVEGPPPGGESGSGFPPES